MGLLFIVPWIQLVGVVIPLLGCIALFRKEPTKASMSLLLTNIGCLLINCIYMLMMRAATEGAALMANKILYMANVLFYFAFMLFVATYLNVRNQKLRIVILSVWAVVEIAFLFNLFIGDPLHVVFLDITFYRFEDWGVTLVTTAPSVIYMVRNYILCVMLIIGMLIAAIRMFKVRAKEERFNLARLVGAQFVIVVALLIRLFYLFPFDIVPLSASFSIMAIIVGVIRGNFFYVTDQGRNWVIDHTDNALLIVDNQYGYLDANPTAKKLFSTLERLEKGERIPQELIQLFYDYSFCVDIQERHFEKEVEVIVQKGKTIGYSMLLIDNTEHYILLEQVEEEKERAEEANKAKSDFMSRMSHEIRTPMNAIVGMTEILLREELPVNTRDYLNNIRSSGDALLTIINDILDFSKIEAGQMNIVKDVYEPMSSLHDLSMIFLNRIGDKKVELLYDIDTNLPEKLYGDRQRIRQVIINLMNNAIKFTDEGYVKLTVKAEPIDEENIDVIYSIEDSGQGIKEEDIKKLFGSYAQVDKEKNHFKEGTGLGLAISKQMVELMDGTIGVTSEYGKGTCFSFRIPQKICSKTKAADIKADVCSAKIISGKFVSPFLKAQYEKLVQDYGVKTVEFSKVWSGEIKADLIITDDAEMLTVDMCAKMSNCSTRLCVLQNPMQQNLSDKRALLVNKPLYSLNFCQVINGEVLSTQKEDDALRFMIPDAKFLIVDDQDMNIKVAKGLLAPLGVKIEVAENGKQAVEMVSQNTYDMVFMDHMMPIMDGVEATKAIRALEDEKYQKLPIVALSANATTEARELFSANGFSDFVAKPIKFKELCACIREWIKEELVVVIESSETKEFSERKKNLIEELVIEGLDVQEGIRNSGSKELFISLLGDFYKLIDQKAKKIEECLADGRIRDYTIEVHALKSTARMIGAMELSKKFYRLEQAGNAGDEKTLALETPDVLLLFRSYKQPLEPFAHKQEKEKAEVSLEKMLDELEKLKMAMDTFDLDRADISMHALESFDFPESCQAKVEELGVLVADVAMEDVMHLVDEIMSILKKNS